MFEKTAIIFNLHFLALEFMCLTELLLEISNLWKKREFEALKV